MKTTGLNGVAIFCGLALVSTISTGQENTGGTDRDLRRAMAGAWRSVQEELQPKADPGSATDQENTKDNPTFHGISMETVAERLAKLDQVLHFDGERCVMATQGHQMIFTVEYENGVARTTDAFSGMALPGEYSLEGGMLVVRFPDTSFEIKYRRLDEIPDSVRLDPYTLGTRQPNDTQRTAIQQEIARRMKRDQDVRFATMDSSKKTPNGGQDPALEAMVSVDQENTNRLVELILDVGWLSKDRFGQETQLGAFLIVQHSGSLRLMRTVLPLIENEAKRDPTLGQHYALLYDRVQIRLGKKQRYGSQAQSNPDGSMTIGRLENRARTNDWRKQMGMEPLEAYAKGLGRMSGVKVTIGE